MESADQNQPITESKRFVEEFQRMNAEAARLHKEGSRDAVQTLHRKMLAFAKQHNDKRMIAEAHGLVGLDAMETGDYRLAQNELKRSVDLLYEFDDAVAIGRALANLANLLRIQGIFDEAKRYSIEALIYIRRTGNQHNEMLVLGNLASQEIERWNHLEARSFLQEAIELARVLGDVHAEVMYLGDMAKIRDSEGRMEDAFHTIDQALALARAHGLRRDEGMINGIAGLIAYSKAQWERAQLLLEQALAIHRETKALRFVGITLHNLGTIAITTGDIELSERYLHEAISIHRTTGNIHSEALTLALMAELAFCNGDDRAAEAMLMHTLQIARDTKNHPFEAMAKTYLAMIDIERDKKTDALGKLIDAVAIYREWGKSSDLPMVLCILAALHTELGDPDSADLCLREVDEIAVRTRNFMILTLAAIAHGIRALTTGSNQRATEWYWQALVQIEQNKIGAANHIGHFFIRFRDMLLKAGVTETNLPEPKNWTIAKPAPENK